MFIRLNARAQTALLITVLNKKQSVKTITQYREITVESLSSVTCPPILMQLTGQNNSGIANLAFLLARTCIMVHNATCVGTKTSKGAT